MKVSEKRKWQVFGILVMILALSLYLSFSDSPTKFTGETKAVSFQPDPSISREETVDIQQLNRNVPRVQRIERNLFQFQKGATQEIVENRLPFITQEAPPMEDIPKVRYLGMYVEKKENGLRLAAVSNSGRVLVGKEGDVLNGRYRILRIESEFLLLQLTSDERKFRVPIGGSTVQFID